MKFNITSYKYASASSLYTKRIQDSRVTEGTVYTVVGLVEVYSERADSGFQCLDFTTYYKGRIYNSHANDGATNSPAHLSRMARQFAAEVVRAGGEAGR